MPKGLQGFQKGYPKPKNAYSFPKGHKVIGGFKKNHIVSEGMRRKIALGVSGERNGKYVDGKSHTKEGIAIYRKRYKARKKNAEGSHTLGEWELLKKQYNHTCPCCHKSEPKITLTEDHIIPLSKGGSDYIENIQPLCRRCNRDKYTKVIKYKLLDN